jgi:hypothetical protein
MMHFTFQNTSFFEDDSLGWVREFNGTNSAGELNDADSKNMWFSTGVTMSSWVYPYARQTTHDRDNIVRKRTYITIDRDGFAAVYGLGLSSPGYHLSNSIIPLNQWTHIAWTWSNTDNTLRIYFNGILDREITGITGTLDNTGTVFTVGGEITSNNRFFNGRIGPIKIYDRALSLTEIEKLYGVTRNYKHNYSDVRFVYDIENLEEEVPWWKERDGTWWLKINLPENGSTTVYAVYGDKTQGTSNGDEVFEFFDEFEGSSVNTSKWTEGQIASTAGVFVVQNGYLRGQNSRRYLHSDINFNDPVVQETLVKERTPANPNGFMTAGFWANTSDALGILSHNGVSYYRNNSSWVLNSSFNGTQVGALRDTVSHNGSSGRIIRHRLFDGLEWDTGFTLTNTISSEVIRLGARYDNFDGNQNYECWWDWLFIRKYSENVITLDIGEEKEVLAGTKGPHVVAHELNTLLAGRGDISFAFGLPVSSQTRGQYLVFPKDQVHDNLGMRTISFLKGRGK